MASSSNVSHKTPASLINQIAARAELTGRTRNQEKRYLLLVALEMIGDREFIVALPGGPEVRSVVWLEHELKTVISERAKKFHRSLSTEITLLQAYAIQEIANRDLALIRSMMQRADPAALAS